MLIAIDFDGTIVPRMNPPLRLFEGARDGLLSLKNAGHILLLYSARANRAVRFNPDLNPLLRGMPSAFTAEDRLRTTQAHRLLFDEMVAFVNRELPGVFDAIDDGQQGKPLADLFIDDKVVNVVNAGGPLSSGWPWIASTYGDIAPGTTRALHLRK